jgi:phage shock protein PspC (stress-responsive transcriptional regulator)
MSGISHLTVSPKDPNMTNATALPLRNDTILGVCEAIGRDFGFNPLYLRLAFIGPLFFAPTATILAYLGLGVLVGLTNWFVADKQGETPQLASTSASTNSGSETDETMPLAA